MSSSMKPWKIIPRPILETVLNNHVQHHRVPQPLFLHGPRGVGKTSLILHRLLDDWNKGVHVTGYVDFAAASSLSPPWTSWTTSPPSTSTSLSSLQNQLEQCLERMIEKGISLGAIGSQQVFQTLNKWHGINTALRRIIQNNQTNSVIVRTVDGKKDSAAVLWSRAVYAMATRSKTEEIDRVLGLNERGRALTVEERSYFREAMLGVRLAKEVIGMHRKWRANAVAELNRNRGFSRPLANSATDWAYLLVELLSNAAEVDHFQPKLVINNIELLRHAISTDDSMVSASMYHDSFLWRLVALGMNERSLPVIFVTSDSYYSYRVTYDFGYSEIFVSRETFGWTPQEAKIHMVDDYFSESEWKVIIEVLGSNPRHLSELYALKQSTQCQKIMLDISGSAFDDIVEAYLAYLQYVDHVFDTSRRRICRIRVTVVNPAMERVLSILQKFAVDAYNGKIPKDQLQFGAPWRRPPRTDNPDLCSEWAKVQLMDFVRSLVKTEFGLNYFADYSLEIFDDPAATAMVEVGLLYTQRDPSFIRPVSRGIEKCLMRWFIQERMQMGFLQSFRYLWQRVIRGRSYRHLMKEIGYK